MNPLRSILKALASLWLAGLVLMLLLFSMACGTAFESIYGTDRAFSLFYGSWWFQCLLVLLGFNTLAVLIWRWPYSKKLIGFAIMHFAVIVILVGALVTKYAGIDGQIAVLEGETVNYLKDRFDDELIVANRATGKRQSIVLPAPQFGGFHTVENATLPPLKVGEKSIAVRKYLPDAAWSRDVLPSTNADAPPAIQFGFGPAEEQRERWVFVGQPAQVGMFTIALRPVESAEKLAKLLGNGAEGESDAPQVEAKVGDEVYLIPLDACRRQPVPVADTGYTVQVMSYMPRASVGEGNRLQNDPARPVNPAAQIEVSDGEQKESRTVFARFPDFSHGQAQIEGIQVNLKASGEDEPLAPVEILVGPEGDLHARYSSSGTITMTQPLEVGKQVETPWPRMVMTIRQYIEHGEPTWNVQPVREPRDFTEPAVQIEIASGGEKQPTWLRKNQPDVIRDGANVYDMVYTDRQIPLGFGLKLEHFRLGFYPGGQAPRSYESEIKLIDSGTGRTRSAVVGMNNPVVHGGFSFYQSSYDQRQNGTLSVLGVSRDPGRQVVFTGYGLIMLGGAVVIIQRLRTGGQVAAGGAQ